MVGSPELAEWQAKVKALFNNKFNPVGGKDGLIVEARIRIDPSSGRVLGYQITKPSGILAWDAAAERALAQVQSIPLPPAKHRLDADSQFRRHRIRQTRLTAFPDRPAETSIMKLALLLLTVMATLGVGATASAQGLGKIRVTPNADLPLAAPTPTSPQWG